MSNKLKEKKASGETSGALIAWLIAITVLAIGVLVLVYLFKSGRVSMDTIKNMFRFGS